MAGLVSCAFVVSGLACPASAADYPKRPVRIVVPFAAGGGTDILARAFQAPFEKALKMKVIVENIAGGSTKLGVMEAMKAKPDGYTLMLMGSEAMIGYYYSKSYDTKVWEKLTAVGNIITEPWVLVEVRANAPYASWAELVRYGKENPGKVTCGSPSAGGIFELTFNEIMKAAGIEGKFVPFAGSGPSKVALLGGHIDFRVCTLSEGAASIKDGQTRGLALSTDKRYELTPGIPTFKELGLGGKIMLNRAIWGPPDLSPEIVRILAGAVEKSTQDADFVRLVEEKFAYKVIYFDGKKVMDEMKAFEEIHGAKLAAFFK
jgi:tripartite-type tricarboxylate transporter receptor subunit TctC